ncbi:hypothetical protein ANN_00572 [Periplaneta americana]|uniref:Uncharacterized protein n=1 Tax=Periplaneta americana TaxID=6978 RepID=A0ABQ8TTK2_PERAM|nr:hypothetical protein ANN_00572 [Periplaneta americana]
MEDDDKRVANSSPSEQERSNKPGQVEHPAAEERRKIPVACLPSCPRSRLPLHVLSERWTTRPRLRAKVAQAALVATVGWFQCHALNNQLFGTYRIAVSVCISVVSGMSDDDEDEGRRGNAVPARSLLLSNSTKGAARLNVPVRRTNHYQQ